MRKRGFVLMEAIVVISVLCVVLIALYAAYSKIIIDVTKKSLYDNTEYIYKTNIVRDYLESLSTFDEKNYNSTNYYGYCSNNIKDLKACYDTSIEGNYENDLFEYLGVSAVYITIWDVTTISESELTGFEATTQNYIKTLDPTDMHAFRIIVMYESENNDTDQHIYEYATLRFGSRG